MTARLPLRHRWREQVLWSTDGRVDAYALAVVMALHAHMSPEGVCRVGLRRLASLARCSVNTVRARIDVLEAAGFLIVKTDGRSRTVYAAVLPKPASTADIATRSVSSGDIAAVSPGDTQAVSAGDTAAEQAVSPAPQNCVTPAQKRGTGRHTFPLNPLNPIAGAREALRRRPSGEAAALGVHRPLSPGDGLEQRADGTLWVPEDQLEVVQRDDGAAWP